MFDIDDYILRLTAMLQERFEERLVYVGLQGSYLRNEATQNSDIDIMVVLAEMTIADLNCYREILLILGDEEKACGFICSAEDLANWNPLEIFHLLNSTKDCYGELARLVPAYSRADIQNFVKISVNNLYHALCHSYIHSSRESNIAKLPGMYKGVFFILQNLYYLKTDVFVPTKARLLPQLSGRDQAVLSTAIRLQSCDEYDFGESFELLFVWCQEVIRSL